MTQSYGAKASGDLYRVLCPPSRNGKPVETLGRKATGLMGLGNGDCQALCQPGRDRQTSGNAGTQSYGTKALAWHPVRERYVRRVARKTGEILWRKGMGPSPRISRNGSPPAG